MNQVKLRHSENVQVLFFYCLLLRKFHKFSIRKFFHGLWEDIKNIFWLFKFFEKVKL